MPIRKVPSTSDRGSIKDIQAGAGDDEKFEPTADELRIKDLYERAMVSRDQSLLDSLGLIVLNGSAKDPIALFRHREYVNSLKDKMAEQIEKTRLELIGCFPDTIPTTSEGRMASYKQAFARVHILVEEKDPMVKIASQNDEEISAVKIVAGSFWRMVK